MYFENCMLLLHDLVKVWSLIQDPGFNIACILYSAHDRSASSRSPCPSAVCI